jgi:FtsZ-binding cell division protein ZapB
MRFFSEIQRVASARRIDADGSRTGAVGGPGGPWVERRVVEAWSTKAPAAERSGVDADVVLAAGTVDLRQVEIAERREEVQRRARVQSGRQRQDRECRQRAERLGQPLPLRDPQRPRHSNAIGSAMLRVNSAHTHSALASAYAPSVRLRAAAKAGPEREPGERQQQRLGHEIGVDADEGRDQADDHAADQRRAPRQQFVQRAVPAIRHRCAQQPAAQQHGRTVILAHGAQQVDPQLVQERIAGADQVRGEEASAVGPVPGRVGKQVQQR